MAAPKNQSEATNLLQYAADFVELEKRHSANKEDDEEEEPIRGIQLVRGTQFTVSDEWPQSRASITLSTSPPLAAPYPFADTGPLAWRRVERCAVLRQALGDTLKTKWKEATTGPQHALNDMLEGGDGQFRRCKELKPFIEAASKLLGATCKDSTVDAESICKDYRRSPADGVLERAVLITRARIWVPVMPTTAIPAGC